MRLAEDTLSKPMVSERAHPDTSLTPRTSEVPKRSTETATMLRLAHNRVRQAICMGRRNGIPNCTRLCVCRRAGGKGNRQHPKLLPRGGLEAPARELQRRPVPATQVEKQGPQHMDRQPCKAGMLADVAISHATPHMEVRIALRAYPLREKRCHRAWVAVAIRLLHKARHHDISPARGQAHCSAQDRDGISKVVGSIARQHICLPDIGLAQRQAPHHREQRHVLHSAHSSREWGGRRGRG